MNASLFKRLVILVAASATALAVDLVSKWLILNVVMVPPRTIELLPFFDLTLGFNTGVSFGLFSDLFLGRPLLLAVLSLIVTTGLVIWALCTERRLETFGLGLITGGAIGNIIDRIRQGAVTDFLDLHLGGWRWPTFNMADVAITVGAALLIAGAFWPRPCRIRRGAN